MTEKSLVETQEYVYQMILKCFKDAGIPPLMQKMIMEGIYSRFQNNAISQLSFMLKESEETDINDISKN